MIATILEQTLTKGTLAWTEHSAEVENAGFEEEETRPKHWKVLLKVIALVEQ